MLYNDLKNKNYTFLCELRGRNSLEYRFSNQNGPYLIASALAVMLLGLLEKIRDLPKAERQAWGAYLNSFQRPNGFYSDEDISPKNLIPGYTEERALFHRTRHVLFALSILGYRPKYEFQFLKELSKEYSLRKWMESQSLANYWDASNKMMDLGLFLDYEARVLGNREARKAIHTILDICDQNTNPKTGYHDAGKSELRNAMAGAMHLYPLYFLCGRKSKYPEKVIDTTLSLQQADGLFGYEVGSCGEDCLDYDAVNILVNFSFLTDYRKEDIIQCLRRVLKALETCLNSDGGFCCHRRREPYWFGTYTTEVSIGESSLWSTYARLLTIAMATKKINDHPFYGEWNLGNNLMEIWDRGIEKPRW